MKTDRVCIFVSSSNHTRDVFERVFALFHRMWPDCPFYPFVGFTTGGGEETANGFRIVAADGESGWRRELAEQLAKLPPQFDHVLLLLDDFLLLRPVDTTAVAHIVECAVERGLPYLRLKSVDRSWAGRFWARISSFGGNAERLPRCHPYYSSLQAAVWRKDHLLWCLGQPGSVWDFEHIVPPASDHWAVCRTVLPYRHVVEKSRWMADAPTLFRRIHQQFEPGKRAAWPVHAVLKWHWRRVKFGMFGYTGMKAKRWLRAAHRACHQVKSPP